MEDENGLQLSLGLSFGGSSTKPKGKAAATSSETKTEELDNNININNKGSKLVDDFKNYFRAGPQKQESGSGSHRNESVKPPENFFTGIPKTPAADTDTSINLDAQEPAGTSNKRKMLFDEMINQKKRERESQNPDLHAKTKQSHISITTEEGSTAENEDVAESEVEGEVRGFNTTGGSSENGYKMGNFSYGVPFSMQSVSFMNAPVKDSGGPITPGPSISGMMQMGPAANAERSGTQPVNSGNMPMMFGYSPVQLPMLDKDNSWGLFSQSQQVHPAFAGRVPTNLAAMQAIARNPAEAGQLDGGTTDQQPKNEGKQPATEENRSSKTEDDLKGSNLNNNRQMADFDFSPIKPGVAADVKFGGSGSFPNLPWVSTTGHGPNGRTISGVTYRFSANQIRIVCACHGSHMSPEEFVRHASEAPTEPVGNFPSSNPAASAQS
ncbi:hypothetical protein ACFE04_017256 [Oxalis oulophora]